METHAELFVLGRVAVVADEGKLTSAVAYRQVSLLTALGLGFPHRVMYAMLFYGNLLCFWANVLSSLQEKQWRLPWSQLRNSQ